MDSVLRTMVDERIGPGEKEELFVRAFSEKLELSESLTFRTYPDCILKAFEIAGVNKDSSVAISVLAPVLYYEIMQKIGCTIIPVDVDTENGMPDVSEVEKSGASAVVLYENCGSIPVKYNTATTYYEKNNYGNITVIEDITESLGSTCTETYKAGSFGNLIVCALEENNVISAGGGAVLGVKSYLGKMFGNCSVPKYCKLTDLNASLGFIQLQNSEENIKRNREIGDLYTSCLASSKHRRFGLNSYEFHSNSSSFSVFMDCKPDKMIEFAKKHGVPVLRTFENSICSLLEKEGDIFEKYPNGAAYYYRTVSFPIYPFLKETEIKTISRIIANLP